MFVAIDDPKARADALENGEIDGYDLVGPADIEPLEDDGFQIVNRDPFNVLYLGMNQKVKPLDDTKVRQAIAYAIDKEEVVDASMPEGTQTAIEFMPDRRQRLHRGRHDATTTTRTRPRQLLEEAGRRGRDDRVQLPDRRQPPVHAAARGHVQRDPHRSSRPWA